MNLGLKRGVVSLSMHDANWRNVFELERELLCRLIGEVALQVEHIGSTAVADLLAKPIMDIAVSVSDLNQMQHWAPKLEAVGYTYFGDRENRGDHFFAKGPDGCRTVYLHIVEEHSGLMDQYVRFRDRLRSNTSARQQYAELKIWLAALYGSDRKRYTAGKSEFIARLCREDEQEVADAHATANAG